MNQDLERIAYWYTSGTGKVLELILKALGFVLLSIVLVILVLRVTSRGSPLTLGCFHETTFWAVHVCVQG